MHCVSIYPTPSEDCNLLNIKDFIDRYRKHIVGWSTHESPNDFDPVVAAYSLGARMFERHVGLETDKIKLNAYSSNPEQVNEWISKLSKTKTLLGNLKENLQQRSKKSLLMV